MLYRVRRFHRGNMRDESQDGFLSDGEVGELAEGTKLSVLFDSRVEFGAG